MEIAEFKVMVADYMNRDASVFGVGQSGKTDKILEAANNAKAYAQRLIRFELAKSYCTLTVTQNTGAYLSEAVKTQETEYGDPLIVYVPLNAFVPDSSGVLRPIDLITRGVHLERLRLEQSAPKAQAVLDGPFLFIEPWAWDTTTVEVTLRVIQWMPDYFESEDIREKWTGDFFLYFCRDWMLYKTVQNLNFFLKEDQRVAISEKVMNEAFESMKAWNAGLNTTDMIME